MRGLKPRQLALLRRRTAGLSTAWRIIRRDGQAYLFTSHDQPLGLPTIRVFRPRPGITTSAVRSDAGLRGNLTRLQGLIDTGTQAGITYADLKERRLDGAKIREYVVNTMWPYVTGGIVYDDWFVQNVEYDSYEWSIELAGWTSLLDKKPGPVIGRECTNRLGSSNGTTSFCPVNIQVFPFRTDGCAVTSTVTPTKTVFTLNNLTHTDQHDTDYFAFGYVVVTSGANIGLQLEVSASGDAAPPNEVQVTLHNPAPYAFVVGDQMTIYVGCARTRGVCRDKFNALQGINGMGGFRGEPDIPGLDQVLSTPNATTNSSPG